MKPGRVFLASSSELSRVVAGFRAPRRSAASSTTRRLQAPRPDRRAKVETEGRRLTRAKKKATEVSKIVDAGPPPDAAVAEKSELCGRRGPDHGQRGSGREVGGRVRGERSTTTRFEGMPERVQPDDKARTRVEEPKPGEVVLVVVDSSNGNPLCSLNADATGGKATIRADQSCFASEGMTATVVEGDAKLDGDRLVFDVQIAVEVDAGDISMDGEIAYHFDGKRR